MPPESKNLSDFQNVITSEMDLQDAIRSGKLDSYAIRIRNRDVTKTSFEECRFSNVLVTNCTMSALNFEGFEAKTVQFSATNIEKSRFKYSEIDELNMINGVARQCDFSNAFLQNSAFFQSEMQTMSFVNSKIVKTQFQDSNMYGADFENAFMAQCKFTCTDEGNPELSRANFHRSMVIDTTFKNANFFSANFTDAILIRVDLRGANICRADFRGAVLIDCQIYPGDKAEAYF